MDWMGIWNSIKNYFVDNIWNIVGFVATLFIGIVIVKLLINISRRIMGKTKMEQITQNFIMAFIKLGLYLVLVLILLSMVGIQITGILTTISALLLAVGMALQNNIANLANGIVIVTTHLFKKGDFVEVGGVTGSVVEIHFLFTTIITTDNKRVTIPNSTIVNNPVTNYGANSTRRVDFMFSVAYETDVEMVKKIVTDVMKSDGRVRLEIEPFCKLKVLGASSIDFVAYCWCDTADYWDVYYYVIENVYNEFKRNNISIPYNQLEIRNRTDEVVMPVIERPLPARVEKERKEEHHKFNLEKDGFAALIRKKDKKIKKEDNK